MARRAFDATADSSGRAATAGLGLFLLLVLSVPIATMYAGWAAQQALEARWDIKGAPCPVAANPALDGSRTPKAFDYGDVHFARRFGHVSCIAATEGGPLKPEIYRACQFTGPGTLAVATAGRTVVFEPGVGRTATVKVERGAASCVLGGWFTANPLPTGAPPRNRAPSPI